jgi:hypothetical protein
MRITGTAGLHRILRHPEVYDLFDMAAPLHPPAQAVALLTLLYSSAAMGHREGKMLAQVSLTVGGLVEILGVGADSGLPKCPLPFRTTQLGERLLAPGPGVVRAVAYVR